MKNKIPKKKKIKNTKNIDPTLTDMNRFVKQSVRVVRHWSGHIVMYTIFLLQ